MNLFRRKPPSAQTQDLLDRRLKLFAMQDLETLIKSLDQDERQSAPGLLVISAAQKIAGDQKTAAIAELREALNAPDLTTWWGLVVWHQLRALGIQPPETLVKSVLAMVIEQPESGGRSILAAYADHTAYYLLYQHSLKMYRTKDAGLGQAIDDLLSTGAPILKRAQPWNKAEPGPPPSGFTRISILTASGLHFGQGPAKLLAKDAQGSKIAQSSLALKKAFHQT